MYLCQLLQGYKARSDRKRDRIPAKCSFEKDERMEMGCIDLGTRTTGICFDVEHPTIPMLLLG